MRIEHVTRNHRVGGRMVLAKRRTVREDRETREAIEGFALKLEGGREEFVAVGEDVEVTTGGGTQTRTRSRR